MKSSIFFTLEKLRDINYQLLKEHNIVKSSNIYFVTKVKKCVSMFLQFILDLIII